MQKASEAHEVDIAKIKEKNEELDEKLTRASKVKNIARVKAGKVKEHVEIDIAVSCNNLVKVLALTFNALITSKLNILRVYLISTNY